MARRRRSSSVFPTLLIAIAMCLAAGCLLFIAGRERIPLSWRTEASAADGQDGANRAELEREVSRLRRELDLRDKQIADLTIQLKLLTEGSTTR